MKTIRKKTDATSLAAVQQDRDLIFIPMAHFLKRVPGYLENHQLICKYKHILVEHLMQSNRFFFFFLIDQIFFNSWGDRSHVLFEKFKKRLAKI